MCVLPIFTLIVPYLGFPILGSLALTAIYQTITKNSIFHFQDKYVIDDHDNVHDDDDDDDDYEDNLIKLDQVNANGY